jgi:hypothetical protein
MKELKFASIRDAIQHLSDLVGEKIKIAANYDTNVSVSTLEEVSGYFTDGIRSIAPMQVKRGEQLLTSFLTDKFNVEEVDVKKYIKEVKAHLEPMGQSLVFNELLPEAGIDIDVERINKDSKGKILNISRNIWDWYRITLGEKQEEIANIIKKAINSISKNEYDEKQLIQTLHKGSDELVRFILKNHDQFLDSPHKVIKQLNQWIVHRGIDAWRKLMRDKKNHPKIENQMLMDEKAKIKNNETKTTSHFDVSDEKDLAVLEKVKQRVKHLAKSTKHPNRNSDGVVDLIFKSLLESPDLRHLYTLEGKLEVTRFIKQFKSELERFGYEKLETGGKGYQAINFIFNDIETITEDMNKERREASMKFASVSEAIQHLSDLTGESIKIATDSKCRLDVTYQIVTEESAEQGDVAESGYEDENVEFDSVYEMIDYMIKEGASEPSSSSFHDGIWYSMSDPIYDRAYFEEGQSKSLSFHPKEITAEEGKIVFDSIKAGKNLAQDPDELED